MGLILKLACYVLAVVLICELWFMVARFNPLRRVAIPALPTLDSETNSLAGATGTGPGKTGTNSPATGTPSTASARTNSAGTNSPATNAVVVKKSKEAGTNLVVAAVGKSEGTNFTVPPPYSEGEQGKIAASGSVTNVSTNLPTPPKMETAGTNSITIPLPTNVMAGVNFTTTNLPPELAAMGTNISLPLAAMGTNAARTNASKKSKSTNSPSTGPAMAAMNMNVAMMGGGGGRSGKSELPPEIKARVDKIYESELFGQIMRPQPMALQGIAGNSAFIRTPSGQTGLVKEGDSLGEIKLLRIGINRVLVEQDGQKSELTIFNGYGSESLMPKDKDKETSK